MIRNFAFIPDKQDSINLQQSDIVPFLSTYESLEYLEFSKIKYTSLRVFRDGDIIISTLASAVERRKMAIPGLKDGFKFGLCMSSGLILRMREGAGKVLRAKFLYYFLLSSKVIECLISGAQGSDDRARIQRRDLLRLKIPSIPDLKTQDDIIKFLDEKTGAISKAIKLGERQLSALKEFESSVIYEALKLNRPPEHWKNIRARDIFRIRPGSTPDTSNEGYYDDDFVRVAGDVITRYRRKTNQINAESPLIPFVIGTDLTSTDGNYIYKGAKNITEIALKESYGVLTPVGSIVLGGVRPSKNSIRIAGKALAIGRGLYNLVLKSNDHEQRQIANYLQEKICGIREALRLTSRLIQLQGEYRVSLINEHFRDCL
jgi:restriction endonuclease S subunit